MADPMTPQNLAEKNARKYFRKAEQGETLAKQALKKERAASEAKTAKLRELRLAKEAADKLAAEAGGTPEKKRSPRRPAEKKRPTIRMVY
jgi:hypothetical protein